jgi:hypothetical protein
MSPYRSAKQAAFVHVKAAEGVPWAKKFVKDSHGSHVTATSDGGGKRSFKGKRKGGKMLLRHA